MRHADKPVITETVSIDASPGAVWRLISDITVVVGPSPELHAVQWLPGGGGTPSVGRQFVGTNRNRHFGEWQTTSTVTECDPPFAFAWAVGDVDEPVTSWRFEVVPIEDGCELTQRFQLGIGESGLTHAIRSMPDKEEAIVARRLAEFSAAMRANLQAIKSAAEGA